MRYKLFRIVVIGILLAACSSELPFTPKEPGILSIAFTPAVAHFAPDFNRCGISLGSTALIGEEVPVNDLSLDNTEIAIRLGAPPLENSQAFVIFEDSLVFITHADNPIKSFNLQEIVTLYTQNTGEISNDADLIDLVPFAYQEGSDIEQVFLNFISVQKISAPNIRIVPNPAAMIQAVSENARAVGVIPLSALNHSVRIIPIQDLREKSDIVELLVMTNGPPTMVQTEWIHCLQDSLP